MKIKFDKKYLYGINKNMDTKNSPIRLKKAIMRTGDFKTPEGAAFSITRTRLDHWVRTFCKMQDNGDVCRIVKDHNEGADSSIGRVTAMERRGDYLYATLEFPTRSMADLTLTNDVSIFSQPTYATGCTTYTDAIKHVSLTPFPLITKLGEYKKLGANAPLVCSLNNFVKQKGTKNMDESLSKAMQAISEFIGMEIPEEALATNEAGIAWVKAIFQIVKQKDGTCTDDAEDKKDEPDDEKKDSNGEPLTLPDDDKDDEKLPPGSDAIIASTNGARKQALNGFVGYSGISAQQVGAWVKKYASCKSLKKQGRTAEAFDALVEGLRCSINGKTNVLGGKTDPQIPGKEEKFSIPGFEKLMSLRK